MEEHTVITDDGYILGMHRIPFGQNGSYNDGVTRPPVFLAHGVTSSSSQWVFGPPQKALGYLLADAGYDVWMGNTRGNTYSKAHVSLDTCSKCKEFWDFGFDETGVYDYSAEIDHILEVTGFEKLRFVGHSMGGTQYMILLSERPEYNDKIQEGYLLAPAVFMTYAPHPVFIFSSLGTVFENYIKKSQHCERSELKNDGASFGKSLLLNTPFLANRKQNGAKMRLFGVTFKHCV